MIDPFGAIDRSISLVRRLIEISKNISEAKFKNLLADLLNDLADAKLKMAELKEQLATQAEEIRVLKGVHIAKSTAKPSVKWGCYQFEGDKNLYCPGCYDTKGTKSLTTRMSSKFRQCSVCQTQVGT